MTGNTTNSSAERHYEVSARYYDTIYADVSDRDGQFYLDLADQYPGPVLELGCGTGRIMLPLARAGHQVHGLDLSTAMLRILRDKLSREPEEVRQRITLLQGDMAQFELDEQFGLILTPFRAWQHLMEPEQQRSNLLCIARQLKPEGRFVYNAFDPNIESIVRNRQAGPHWLLDHDLATPDGGRLLRYYMVKAQPPLQVQDVYFRYEVYDAEGRLSETQIEKIEMRWQTRYEARYLIELCGMEIEEAYGSYDRQPMDERQRELIFICRRKRGH